MKQEDLVITHDVEGRIEVLVPIKENGIRTGEISYTVKDENDNTTIAKTMIHLHDPEPPPEPVSGLSARR